MSLFVTECNNPQPLPFLDSQITASTSSSTSYSARHARINDLSGWASVHRVESYLLVDHLQRATITAVSVQGMVAWNIWSQSMSIYYSNDNVTFIYLEVSMCLHLIKVN